MWHYFAIVFLALFSFVTSQSNTQDNDCVCVPYYLCRNGTVITDGEGIIDERIGKKCKNAVEVCCRFNNQTTRTTTEETEIPETKSVKTTGCGFRNPDGVRYKINSNEDSATEFGEFPWMVGILMDNGVYRCGGSLIHPSVVLTAAHCVIQNKTYVVRAGEWDSSSTNEILKKQDRTVSSIKIHEDYRPGIYYNDIALLFLSSPLKLQAHINVACLSPSNTVDDNSRCYVTGWGKKNFGKEGQYPAILKKVELLMVPRSTCQENLRKTRLGQYFQLHRSFVCAGGEEGKDACIGDGGGPLVCPIAGEDERYQQIGIVSWGIGCSEKDVPGVYAGVAFLRTWIDKQMKIKNFEINGYQY